MERNAEKTGYCFEIAELVAAAERVLHNLPVERIEDEDKREEFLSEYDRLVVRCGTAAMSGIFNL